MFTGKIFCVGFHKTGTTSLAVALDHLGYRVTGSFGLIDPHIATTVLAQAVEIVPRYDAFQDNPWPVIFRQMDQRYPGSKFILTTRTPEAWMASALRHFGGHTTPMRQWIYGAGDPCGNEALYLQRYRQHNADVLAHFAKRPFDLLVLDLSVGDGWEKLCPFLQIGTQPTTPFPHANSHADRSKLINKVKYHISTWFSRQEN